MLQRTTITGLVIRFDPAQENDHRALISSLATDDRYDIGELMHDPPRLPVVLETPTSRDSRDAIDQLREQAGVMDVAVVFIDLGSTHPQGKQQPQMSTSSQGQLP